MKKQEFSFFNQRNLYPARGHGDDRVCNCDTAGKAAAQRGDIKEAETLLR